MSFEVDNLNLGAGTPVVQVPALEYISGKRTWYAITLQYKTLGKFVGTTGIKPKGKEIIGLDIRNRFLDRKHKDDIKDYIKIEEEFIIPPITLVATVSLDFRPYTFNGVAPDLETTGSRAGIIMLPLDFEFECLDGNHRSVAIKELAFEEPSFIAGSNMLLNIVIESRARKIRQDFVDVNKNAKPTTSSINTLFNTRDPLSALVSDIVVDGTIEGLEYLNETTELLATSVSKNSKKIFTINNIKNAIVEIGGYNSQSTGIKTISEKLTDEDFKNQLVNQVKIFFEVLKENPTIKQCIVDRESTPVVREKNIITSGTGIIVLARIAGNLFNNFDENEVNYEIRKVMELDWSRDSELFQGNILVADKIVNSRGAIELAVEKVEEYLGY
ncbi:MAG: DNA sulfur modification protein DndB [Desulfitobacteriaceae bacterium]|nr:DNA sulfur modification protein DndB [Desulfitobacteriaceae bacterium]